MRPATFKAKRVSGDRKWAWRVYIPANKSPNGKARQIYGETKAQAESRVVDLIGLRDMHGDLSGKLTQHQLSEAVRAVELLKPQGISLLDAVVSFLADRERRTASVTFRAAWDAYEALKVRSRGYQKELQHTKAKIEHLLYLPIVDVDSKALGDALKDCAVSTRDSRIRRLRSVFGMAVRKGWTTVNVADQLDIVGKRHLEVRIYTVDQVERLLQTAKDREPSLVVFLALGFFCGLRPENELRLLKREDCHLEDSQPQIVVNPATSKTRSRRFVDVSDNCRVWLSNRLLASGRVIDLAETTLTRKLRKLYADTEIERIPDGMRHTFASAHLAKFKDVNKTCLQLGHFGSPSLLFRHYHRTMTEADAQRYWSIEPTSFEAAVLTSRGCAWSS